MATFREMAAAKGWSKDEQIDVLVRFAETHSAPDAFEGFIAGQEGYDDGLQSFTIVALWPEGGSWSEDVRESDQGRACELAKDIMADNSCITFDDEEQRQDFKASIEIIECS